MPLTRLLLALAAAGLLLFALPARAVDVPRQMTFQGRLVRADGSPETAPQDLRFALYATSSGGAPLWEETLPGTSVTNGYYAVVLGTKVPLPANVLNGQALYLGVSLVGQSELTPRLPVVSVPYALRADDSNRLEGRAANTFADASHSHASVPYADAAGTATTADNSNQLQGNAASAFALANHNHNTSYAPLTHGHSLASSTAGDGFVTSGERTKLNSLLAVNTAGAGLSFNGATSTLSVSFSTSGGTNGTATTAARSDHGHSLASGTTDGFVSGAERTKLGSLLAVNTAGAGLSFNGATSTLSVSFSTSGGTNGTATTAARSDHTHAAPPTPVLTCTYKTATGNTSATSSTAYCATNEVLTGGGCLDLGAATALTGSASIPDGVTTVDGSTSTTGHRYLCRQPTTGTFIAPTAYAICCRIP